MLRDEVLGATVLPSSATEPPLVGRLDAENRLGQGRLAGTRFADDAERLALGRLEIDIDERGNVVAALPERLREVGQLEHLGVGVRWSEDRDRRVGHGFDHLGDAVGVMATRPTCRRSPTGTTGGTTVRQVSSARGQRSTNTQVGRSLPISGKMPGMVASARSVLRTPCRGRRAQQPHGVWVLWIVEHLVAGALLHDPTGVHHADPITQRADDAEVVGDQQHGGVALLAQRANEIEHLGLHRGIETGGRLVEHEELRVASQRHGDDHTLLHATGQLERIAIHHACRVGDSHPPQRLERRRLCSGLATDRAR